MAGMTGGVLPSGADHTTIAAYLAVLRRQLLLIVTTTVIGAAVGAGIYWQALPEYTSTAGVLLTPAPTFVSLDSEGEEPDEISIDTDARLVAFRPNVRLIARATGVDEDEVEANLAISAPTSTRVLEVSYSAHDPEDAQLGASTAAGALLETRRRLLIGLERSRLQLLNAEIQRVQADLDTVLPGEETGDYAEGLTEQLTVLEQRRTGLQRARKQPGEIIDQANLPTKADSSDPGVPIGSGAALGLLVGIGIGTFRDAWGQRSISRS